MLACFIQKSFKAGKPERFRTQGTAVSMFYQGLIRTWVDVVIADFITSLFLSLPVPSQMLCTRFQRSWKGRSTWSLQPTPSLWKCQRPSCTCRKTVSASPQRQAAYLGNKTENKDGHWYVLYYFHRITRWLLFWSWFDLLNDTACSKNELYADSMTALLYD